MGRLIVLVIGVVICCALPQSLSGQSLAVDHSNTICCYIESNIRIHHKRLESYYWTRSTCPFKLIVFVTTTGRHICMSPEYQKVQQYINHIDKKRPSKSTKLNLEDIF